ncbi:NAD(P)-dependent oxidoreductase [Nocardioides sp. URHA0032]|uniref:NAD(P)-dependent oxidoreductase n=1 Tax=Nocardioides sp. URHA0032 TaxID=1380388 RepID=UPI00048C9A8A|nr:NAD(P)-dependent oxidoreductase [Nocardioides sp. URHA0032]
MTAAPTVALLGTGTMGAGMARNLAAAGLPLRVWNRTSSRAEPLADLASVASSVRDAVSGADVVVTMLFDEESTAETMASAKQSLAPGAVWVQSATVGVQGAARLAALADELGVRYVDAPVLGTRQPAEAGALVVLASGPPDVRDAVAPVFDAIGNRTLWVSENAGDGSRLKLVANAWVFTVVEGVAESLALARDLGLDPALFLSAVEGGATDSPYVQSKGRAMLEGAFDPAFALSGALKDTGLVLEAASAAGTSLGLMPGIREHFQRAVDAGHGDLDMSATYAEH